MAYVKKGRLDPREEYKVVNTYNPKSKLEAKDILTSDEVVDYMYRLVIKYS